ncbi:MAG: pseudouridine synthase [Thalassotalea sp.]
MTISHQRLDKFISKHCQVNRKAVKLMLAKKRILVDDLYVRDVDLVVNKFSKIALDNEILQAHQPVYLMLHKPVGVVSSTKSGNVNERLKKEDPSQIEVYQTVIELINRDDRQQLHYAGRLDLNTSGLMLLTNDSRWSERLSLPNNKVEKRYIVTLANKLTPAYIDAFAAGMYFKKEDVITKPAKLTILSDYVAEVTLVEGRYHQIKRMFGQFDNPVVALHRESIGNLSLGNDLAVGASRELSEFEVSAIFNR